MLDFAADTPTVGQSDATLILGFNYSEELQQQTQSVVIISLRQYRELSGSELSQQTVQSTQQGQGCCHLPIAVIAAMLTGTA